ncbi:ABC transporter substrate-binding protein [Pendulispora albinea]|uniref:ABC transporter substrate-binding protein n=1 Tax=Pendulispora albinea TaxID=2741071 RepID=A0ABZ2LW39_9BACT
MKAIGRRTMMAGAGASLAMLGGGRLFARGRLPTGGRLALRVPWPVSTVDPHRVDDVAAAIFGEALFDTLYARDEAGNIVPSLAEGDPEPDKDGLRVRVRAGIVSAYGKPIDAREVVNSLRRARSNSGGGWLADSPFPTRIDQLTVRFATKDPLKLTQTLSSPLVAIVPLSFTPERPDGTGPFRAERRGDTLALLRNPRAARGPALLDEIIVRAAPDLAGSLRAFESGADDIGWLGSGLHEPRPGAKSFDLGPVAWAILRSGREGAAWDTPGLTQRIADGIPHSRLSYLGLGAAWSPEREEGWGGPASELLVREDAPWLVELARAVSATLSRPGHDLTVRPISAAELATRRAQRSFALAVDVTRPVAPGALGALVGLAAADRPASAVDIVRHPPRLGNVSPRTLTRTMRVGILGEVRIFGSRVADLALASSTRGPGWDLGLATRSRR